MIKKLTILVLFVALFPGVKAQDTEINNKFILGGSMNLTIQNNTYPFSSLNVLSGIGGIYSNGVNDVKNTVFAISPYFGKEINPRLIVGLQLDYRIGKYKSNDAFVFNQPNPVDFETNSNQIGIGLFTRHILNPEKTFNFFIQPYIEYNSLKEDNIQDNVVTQEEKASYIEMGVGIGLMYNINNSLRATLRAGGINYVNGQWEIVDTDTKKDFSAFGTNINLSTIYFGFEVRI